MQFGVKLLKWLGWWVTLFEFWNIIYKSEWTYYEWKADKKAVSQGHIPRHTNIKQIRRTDKYEIALCIRLNWKIHQFMPGKIRSLYFTEAD